jgi:hypothetical protein
MPAALKAIAERKVMGKVILRPKPALFLQTNAVEAAEGIDRHHSSEITEMTFRT